MPYRSLYIFFEGPDDERFITKIIKPIYANSYNYIKLIPYSKEPAKFVNNFIKSIDAMPNTNYLFFADYDSYSCITSKKEFIKSVYTQINTDFIYIVMEEIESWYLAGLNEQNLRKLGINCVECTDTLTKEQFNLLKPRKFKSRLDFMIEILNIYCKDTAKSRNKSFKYFIDRFDIA